MARLTPNPPPKDVTQVRSQKAYKARLLQFRDEALFLRERVATWRRGSTRWPQCWASLSVSTRKRRGGRRSPPSSQPKEPARALNPPIE